VNKNILLQPEIFRNIRAAFTTTVYAFLNPRRPSAAWDFFCLKFDRGRTWLFKACRGSFQHAVSQPKPVGAGLPANRAMQCDASG
jgi:hypothetical protein